MILDISFVKNPVSYLARLFQTFYDTILGRFVVVVDTMLNYVTIVKIVAPPTSQLVFVKYQMAGKSMYLAVVLLAHYSDCPIGTTPLVMFTLTLFIA